jgi:predicted phage-related endonuclease
MLSPDQIRQRDGKLTASRVACLMTGDAEKITNLWRELVGDPAFVEEDLSDVWAIALGAHTEALNISWFQRRTGKELTRQGQVVVHPTCAWAAATLDAWIEEDGHPLETKHVGGFEPIEKIVERYMPQMHWQMLVSASYKCALSVIMGAREPIVEIIEYDEIYGKELWTRACAFMICVETMTPPTALPAVAAPVVPVKTYDFTGNNAFANEAATWITTRQARRDNEAADKALKAMVPADAIKCLGHGITISRSKSGALSIREKE